MLPFSYAVRNLFRSKSRLLQTIGGSAATPGSEDEVVTFGAPMVGNAAAAEAFARELPNRVFRYVDVEDPVPLLPTVSLVANTYRHCMNEVQI